MSRVDVASSSSGPAGSSGSSDPPASPRSSSTDGAPRALFRQEALDARDVQWLGTIRIAQPIGDRVAAALAVAVLCLLVAFAVFGSYTRRATVAGLLEPEGGALRMTAVAGGTVLAIEVVEGQRVAAGDVLFVLSGERVSASGPTHAMIGTQLDARRVTLERDLALGQTRHEARVRSARERLVAIDVERERLEQEIEINAARRRIARANVERYESLARTGFVSASQAQARLDDALVLDAQLAGLRRLAAGLVRERNGFANQIEDSRLQGEAERSDVERALAALAQERSENDARRTAIVAAPHAAQVTGIAIHAGQSLPAGGLLATLIPEHAKLDAEVFASTRQAGFVARGQRVRLRYAAYPYQKFGFGEGVVDAIEQSPYAPQELPAHVVATLGPAAFAGSEPLYRIVVKIDAQSVDVYGHAQPLKPGMVFEADIVQERRRLYEWLLEPVFGWAAR